MLVDSGAYVAFEGSSCFAVVFTLVIAFERQQNFMRGCFARSITEQPSLSSVPGILVWKERDISLLESLVLLLQPNLSSLLSRNITDESVFSGIFSFRFLCSHVLPCNRSVVYSRDKEKEEETTHKTSLVKERTLTLTVCLNQKRGMMYKETISCAISSLSSSSSWVFFSDIS
jgi:hypothetical protein